MSDEKVEPGEEVITSGGDRIFPKGLPVGKVVSVEPGKDLFLNIRVVPSARLDQVEEVLIVTKITEKMPDSKELGPLRASDILAERLPTVPTKPEVDAAGKAKPGAANGTASGAPPATGTGATTTHSGAAATSPANKPATGSPTAPAPKSNGAASGTRPAGTVAKPLNGAQAPTAPDARQSKPAAKQPPHTNPQQPSTPPNREQPPQ
jgi:rod shape-determining protein MreC